jgi:hypothetical protein
VTDRHNYPPRESAIATGRITRERACDGKRKIRTPEYAARVAQRVGKQHGKTMGYYFCVFCECYHLFTEK